MTDENRNFLGGIAIGIILGVGITRLFATDSYHPELCQERFAHAETAADSLSIIQDDKYCLNVTVEE